MLLSFLQSSRIRSRGTPPVDSPFKCKRLWGASCRHSAVWTNEWPWRFRIFWLKCNGNERNSQEWRIKETHHDGESCGRVQAGSHLETQRANEATNTHSTPQLLVVVFLKSVICLNTSFRCTDFLFHSLSEVFFSPLTYPILWALHISSFSNSSWPLTIPPHTPKDARRPGFLTLVLNSLFFSFLSWFLRAFSWVSVT